MVCWGVSGITVEKLRSYFFLVLASKMYSMSCCLVDVLLWEIGVDRNLRLMKKKYVGKKKCWLLARFLASKSKLICSYRAFVILVNFYVNWCPWVDSISTIFCNILFLWYVISYLKNNCNHKVRWFWHPLDLTWKTSFNTSWAHLFRIKIFHTSPTIWCEKWSTLPFLWQENWMISEYDK